MRKKSKITKMVLKLEEENDQYINRNKHILKGYIKNNENNQENDINTNNVNPKETINFLNQSNDLLDLTKKYSIEIFLLILKELYFLGFFSNLMIFINFVFLIILESSLGSFIGYL